MNIIETVNGKLHLVTFAQGLNGYCVVCSENPYYLANNGVEIDFEFNPITIGSLVLLIAPYKIRMGIPEFILKNYDMVAFDINQWGYHVATAIFSRNRIKTTASRTYSSDVFSGKLRIENKGGVTSCYFNADKIGSFPQMSNMNVAVFIEAYPYTDQHGTPRVLEAYVDTLSIDDVATAMLGTQWADMMWVMMTAVMLMALTTIIKKIREVRK